jgi:hypothetical protein
VDLRQHGLQRVDASKNNDIQKAAQQMNSIITLAFPKGY